MVDFAFSPQALSLTTRPVLFQERNRCQFIHVLHRLASNTGGSATTTITVEVEVALHLVSRQSKFVNGRKGHEHYSGCPNNGGPVVSWSITPALPAGLSFNTSTGEINGTPTAVSPSATYTITATNAGGSAPR